MYNSVENIKRAEKAFRGVNSTIKEKSRIHRGHKHKGIYKIEEMPVNGQKQNF